MKINLRLISFSAKSFKKKRSLISFNLEDIKIMSLIAFKELTKKSEAEIIIITSENIKKQRKNDEKVEKNL